jgi:hypothetical protein
MCGAKAKGKAHANQSRIEEGGRPSSGARDVGMCKGTDSGLRDNSSARTRHATLEIGLRVMSKVLRKSVPWKAEGCAATRGIGTERTLKPDSKHCVRAIGSNARRRRWLTCPRRCTERGTCKDAGCRRRVIEASHHRAKPAVQHHLSAKSKRRHRSITHTIHHHNHIRFELNVRC